MSYLLEILGRGLLSDLTAAFRDVLADTADTPTDRLEEQVRRCPEQYLWVHRKFKDLPENYPDYYADLDALK